MQVYYFGVWNAGQTGHHLHTRSGRFASRDTERALPFALHILDSNLLPQEGDQVQGVVHRSVINGWTVLTFWDRSGDSRGNSNSAFVLEGEHTADAGLAIAREMFPHIFGRFTFAVEPVRK